MSRIGHSFFSLEDQPKQSNPTDVGPRNVYSVVAAAAMFLLAGCACYTGDEFVCQIRAVTAGYTATAANEFVGCSITNQPLPCIGCMRFDDNGSFEYKFTGWTGDSLRVVTRNERILAETPPDPILPCSWSLMAQVIYTGSDGPGDDVSADLYQVIDLRQAPLPDPGVAVTNMLVNRVATAFSDALFGIKLEAYQGNPAAFPNGAVTLLGESTGRLNSDNNVEAWEWVSSSMSLPAGTDFLVVTLSAIENARNDITGTEFFGHYIDGVRVEIGPEGAYDLQLAQYASRSSARSGEAITLTLEATLSGLAPVEGVQVQAGPGEGWTYISHAGDGEYDPDSGLWVIGTISPGESATMEIQTHIAAESPNGVQLSNEARFVSGTDGDIVDGNNTAEATVQVLPFVAYDLVLYQDMNPATLVQGDSAHFTLTLENLGPNAVNTRTQVGNVLPLYFFPQRYETDRGTYDPVTDTWVIPRLNGLPAQSSATLHLTAIAGLPGRYYDPVYIAYGLGERDDPTNNSDSVLVNVSASTEPYDIEVTVEAETPIAIEGDLVGFIIRARNIGSTAAVGLTISDALGDGLTYAADVVDHGTYDPAERKWSMAYLLPGQTVTLLKRFTNAPPGIFSHNARVSAGNDDDPNPSNDIDQATMTVSPAEPYNLALSVLPDDEIVKFLLGDTLEVSMAVTNEGPGLSPPAVLNVNVPPGIEVLGLRDGTPFTGQVPLGHIQPGTTRTHYLSVRGIQPLYRQDLRVSILGASARDTNERDDVVLRDLSVVTAPQVVSPIPDLVLSVGRSTLLLLSDYFDDLDDSGPTYTATATPSGIVDIREGLLLSVTAVAPGAADIIVTATDRDQLSASDTFRVTVTPQAYDLQASMTTSSQEYSLGVPMVYSTAITHDPPSVSIPGVQVRQPIPAGLTYVSHTVSTGAYDPATGLWSFDATSASLLDFLSVTVRADTAGTYLATATIIDGLDNDTDATNDTASVAIVARARYDLTLSVLASASSIAVGEQVLVDIVVGNAGSNIADDVEVTYQLPTGLTYISDTGGGNYNPVSGIWTIGALGPGPSAILRVVAEGATPDTYVTTVAITNGLEGDINPTNNTADVSVTVLPSVSGR